jgi:hypothetical protein
VRQPFDHQRYGRARHHRQGAGATLADDPRHRLRRHCLLHAPGFQDRRRGNPQRLGRRRDALRRLRQVAASAATGWSDRQPRLPKQWPSALQEIRHAVRAGAGKACHGRQRAGAGDRRGGWRGQRGVALLAKTRLSGHGVDRPHGRAALSEGLGAAEVIDRSGWPARRAAQQERWAGARLVGSATLAKC